MIEESNHGFSVLSAGVIRLGVVVEGTKATVIPTLPPTIYWGSHVPLGGTDQKWIIFVTPGNSWIKINNEGRWLCLWSGSGLDLC